MIYVRTYGRSSMDRQYTVKNLIKAGLEFQLVVQDREYKEYRWANQFEQITLFVLPPHIQRLNHTDQYLMEEHLRRLNGNEGVDHPVAILMDDDLTFAIRREDKPAQFKDAAPENIKAAVSDLHSKGFHFGLAGMAGREGANRNTGRYVHCARQMRCNAIDVRLFRSIGARFDRVDVMEDFDVTLQFIEAGHPNCILNWIVQNQPGSANKGGVEHYRTPEVQRAAAEKLVSLHPPGVVKVVTKATKTSWGGGERTDVTIYWKKAAKQ